MAIPKNTFVLIEYTLRVKDTGELVDTTSEELAKKEGKYSPDKVYEPLLVIVGEGRIIKGLEEHIEQQGEVGKEFEIEIPPEKAYGERDPGKVKIFNMRELLRNGIVPEVGKTVEIGNAVGVVKAISGGRVLIDFNHPLAGKTLVCRYKILRVIEDDAEKVKHLLHRRYKRVPLDKFAVEIDKEKKEVKVVTPREILLDRDLQLVKALVAEEIYRFLGDYQRVTYVDTFEKSAPSQ